MTNPTAKASPLSPAVTRKLGHYVYLYIRPDTNTVFYVGMGKGGRAFNHFDSKGSLPHNDVIRELESRGLQPTVEFLIHGLKTREEALAVEMAAIDLLGLDQLSNVQSGHHRSRRGRMTLDQIRTVYGQKPAKIIDPVVLIRISKRYRYGMDPGELYDATRSSWKVAPDGRGAEYALAVFEGIVREVYRISAWLPAGSTYRHDHPQGQANEGHFEFVGTVAEPLVRDRYLNRSVAEYLTQGSQNPIRYVGCR